MQPVMFSKFTDIMANQDLEANLVITRGTTIETEPLNAKDLGPTVLAIEIIITEDQIRGQNPKRDTIQVIHRDLIIILSDTIHDPEEDQIAEPEITAGTDQIADDQTQEDGAAIETIEVRQVRFNAKIVTGMVIAPEIASGKGSDFHAKFAAVQIIMNKIASIAVTHDKNAIFAINQTTPRETVGLKTR